MSRIGAQPVAEHLARAVHVVGCPRIAHRGPHRPGRRGEPAAGDRHTRGTGGDVLDGVGLVEDDRVVGREYLSVGEHMQAVEVGVHDQHIDVGRRVPGSLSEALRTGRAVLRARALPPGDAHGFPRPVGRLEVETGPVPVRGLLGPIRQPRDLVAGAAGLLSRSGRNQLALLRGGGRGQISELLEADVVRPALQHREPQRRAQSSLQLGQVLVDELVLEGLGGGGYDRLLAAHRDGREVGHRLAGTGAGRDHQVPVLVEGNRHGFAHLPLSGALLPAARHGGDDAAEGFDSGFRDAHRHRRYRQPLAGRARGRI